VSGTPTPTSAGSAVDGTTGAHDVVKGRSQRAPAFLSTEVTGFIRASVVVVALVGIVGSCRYINAEVQERSAWKRYRELEHELGLRRGMSKEQLLSRLDSKGIEYEVAGDPSRPPDNFPPQVAFVVVAKWTGPWFPQQLLLVADLAADGDLSSWRPWRQGGP
jgi:hypothetical protein